MAFERPTLGELITRIQADFVSRMELEGAVLRRAVVRILSVVLAGAVHMLYGRIEYLAKELFADLATGRFLERIASLFGIYRSAAEFAVGHVAVTGTNGTLIPAGTVLRRSDGAQYTTSGDITVSSGTANLPVGAVLAGAAGDADSGVVFTFESPLAGVSATATVTSAGIIGGADTESDDSLRARLLVRLRTPPQGGAEADYVAWALEVPGVTRVWVTPRADGAGTVRVRFVRDDDADFIPSAGEVTAVQDYIDERRPVTAAVTVSAPTVNEWSFLILLTPDTAAIRAAVEAELEDLFQREGEPGGTIPLSRVRTAIGSAAGIVDYELVNPSDDLTQAAGEIPVLYTVDWEA
jgi:uncharacterized phage protein gp47/JayE